MDLKSAESEYTDEDDMSSVESSEDSNFTIKLKNDLTDALNAAIEGVSDDDLTNEEISTAPRATKPFAAASSLDFECTAFGRTQSLPCTLNPGLNITGLGRVNLPLPENDRSAISQHSVEKSSLEGARNAGDRPSNCLFELDACHFVLQNPKWAAYLQNVVVPQALVQLGFDREGAIQTIAAKTSKLCSYTSGSSVKSYLQNRPSDEHFGTLYIVLPSRNGGTHLSLKGPEGVFDFKTDGTNSEWNSYWTATRRAAEELTVTVTDGSQLVVVFDLVYNYANGGQSISRQISKTASILQRMFQKWETRLRKSKEECPFMLADRLEEYYHDDEVGFDKLKGRDRSRLRLLRQASLEAGFQICLANLHRTVDEPYSWNNYSSAEEISVNVSKAICACGENGMEETIGTGISASGDEEDDSHEMSEVESRIVHYRDTIFMLIPTSNLGEWVLSSPNFEMTKWIDYLVKDLLASASTVHSPQRQAKVDQLRNFCLSAVQRSHLPVTNASQDASFLSNEYVQRMTQVLRASGAMYRSCKMSERYNDQIVDALSIIEKVVFDWVPVKALDALRAVSALMQDVDFTHLKDFLSKGCEFLPSLATHWEALQMLHQKATSTYPERVEGFSPWLAQEVELMLSRKLLDKSDGQALASLLAFEEDFAHSVFLDDGPIGARPEPLHGIENASGLQRRIFSILSRPSSRAVVMMSFLNKLGQSFEPSLEDMPDQEHENWTKDSMDAGTHQSTNLVLFRDILQNCVDKISAERERRKWSLTLLTSQELSMFTYLCLQHAQKSSLENFWAGFSLEVSYSNVELFERLYIPYLKSLLEAQIMPTLIKRTSAATASSCFLSIIHTYIRAVNGLAPSKPTTWTRAVPSCIVTCRKGGRFAWLVGGGPQFRACEDCNQLRDFMQDPERHSETFRVNEDRRKHIQWQLPDGKYKTWTDRTGKTPYGLCVEKTNAEYEDEFRIWEDRRQRTKRALKDLEEANPQQFRDLVRDEYGRIMALDAAAGNNDDKPVAPHAARTGPLNEMHHNISSSMHDVAAGRSPRKRKAEELEDENEGPQIIDLT